MNTQLITESPGWLIILCVWLALAYAAGMYYRHKRLSDIARWKVWLMAGLRFW